MTSNPLIIVTRQVHFNAAHRLHNPTKSDEWNRNTFGKCNSPNFHGHNYVLDVQVRGHPDPDTGYVIDLGLLAKLVHDTIVEPCDHRNLNLDVPFLFDIMPSVENMVVAFWNQLAPKIPSGTLHCLRLFETPRNSVEYYGPDRTANP